MPRFGRMFLLWLALSVPSNLFAQQASVTLVWDPAAPCLDVTTCAPVDATRIYRDGVPIADTIDWQYDITSYVQDGMDHVFGVAFVARPGQEDERLSPPVEINWTGQPSPNPPPPPPPPPLGPSTDPTIKVPDPGSILTDTSQTFSWSSGLNVVDYQLYVGNSRGSAEYFAQDVGLQTSATVSGLPADGRQIHVRLWWMRDEWTVADYVFTAAGGPPQGTGGIPPQGGRPR